MNMESQKYSLTNRKLKIHLFHAIILIIIFAVATYTTKDSTITSLIAICFVSSVFIMIFLLCDVTLRLCQILVSLTDANQESAESFISLMNHYFAVNTASAIIFIFISLLLFLGLIVTSQRCPLNYIWDFEPYVYISLMIFAFCLIRIIDLAQWETKVSPLSTMKGLDYGTGMAYSYYYGYLRMILSSTGMINSKSIIEKIENFEDNHNITLSVHKMFILIPSSGYIPPDLKHVSYQWMESVRELEEETQNRAGVICRRYHNSVYKIYPDGQKLNNPKYVVVEGATPLLTYYEVQKHNHPESVIYQQYKKEIIKMFYKTLQKILQNEHDISDLCELIYYDDFDSHGVKINVAKIILERISKIESSI